MRPVHMFPPLPLAAATLFGIAPGHAPRPRAAAPSKAKAKAARIRALQRKARLIQRQAAR